MVGDHSHLSNFYQKQQELLDVGLAVHTGAAPSASAEAAVSPLVQTALGQAERNPLPVRLALLIATGDWCAPSLDLPATVRRVLKGQLGYDVPLIGGSTALFYCSTLRETAQRFIERGLLLLLFRSNEMRFTVSALPAERLHAVTPAERRRALDELVRQLERRAGTQLGVSANRFLFGFLPGVVTDEQGARSYHDHELHQELLAASRNQYFFFGASTTSNLEQTSGYQFADDVCLPSGLALGFLETDLCMGSALTHGFRRASDRRFTVTNLADADAQGAGYVVTHLDGKSVPEWLQEIEEAQLMRLDRPVFGLHEGQDDYKIYWPHEPVAGQKFLTLKRQVTLGDSLYLLDANLEEMLATAQKSINDAIERSFVKLTDISLLFCFSCGGRIKQYGEQRAAWKETVEQARREHPGVPLVGVMSAGEFGLDAAHQPRSDNMSLSVICATNAYTPRARGKTQETQLLRAASRLLDCELPGEVMHQAIAGAKEAGATGGKISLVDAQLGRILGKGFGYVAPAEGTGHNWGAVEPFTDYAIPAQRGGKFPLELRDFAMPALPELPVTVQYVAHATEKQWEDILQVVVRTLHAVFLKDSREWIGTGLIYEKACRAGRIRSQLVVPLIGAHYRVLATLQLSFSDGVVLDRESLVRWVSYAQKVAAALERAEEIELRKNIEQLTSLSDEITRTSINRAFTPHQWCQEYIEQVVSILGADGGNIRTLRLSHDDEGPVEYKLRGVVGRFADILREARPNLRIKDRTFRLDVLERGGEFVNTEKKVKEFNRSVEALEEKPRFAESFDKRLKQIKATALLPLRDQERVLGSLVLDSDQQYFFTARRQQIARVAATLAGTILQAKRAEYFRANLHEGLAELADIKSQWYKKLTESESTAKERLQKILANVCRSTGADVGSIFIWREEQQKLRLHTCHNWYEPLEGKAEYEAEDAGLSWTWSLVDAEEDVSLYGLGKGQEGSTQRKYYKEMIPPEHRYDKQPEADNPERAGVRLTDGKNLLGVLTLLYYKTSEGVLRSREDMVRPFLQGAAMVVTLGLEATLREEREKRAEQLIATKAKVGELLIARKWREAEEQIRMSCEVERVTFYERQDDKLIPKTKLQAEAFKPVGLLETLCTDDEIKFVLLPTPNPKQLRGWPDQEEIRNLLAVPVKSQNGSTLGVLELVNQKEDAAQPYRGCNRSELEFMARTAVDLALPFGAASQVERDSKALKVLNEQLLLAQKVGARGLFSQLVMHQVKTPFSNMRKAIEWLKAFPDCPLEDRQQVLQKIEAYCLQALATVKRAGVRGAPAPVQNVKLRTLLREALNFIEPARPQSVAIERAFDSEIEVRVEEWALIGALINLLMNALDVMQDGGILSLHTRLASDAETVFVHIHNTCARPPTEAEIKRFFQPGYSGKDDAEHSGMGLPLAHDAIASAGGTLNLRPSINGVEAIISLPVAKQRSSKATK